MGGCPTGNVPSSRWRTECQPRAISRNTASFGPVLPGCVLLAMNRTGYAAQHRLVRASPPRAPRSAAAAVGRTLNLPTDVVSAEARRVLLAQSNEHLPNLRRTP